MATKLCVCALTVLLAVSPVVAQQDPRAVEIEKLKRENVELRAKLAEATLANQLSKAQQELNAVQLELQRKELQAQVERLLEEIKTLNKVIKEREATIIRLEAGGKKPRAEAPQDPKDRIREEALLARIRELTAEIARLQARATADLEGSRGANDPNPPSVLVNGKIEKVDKDIVQISLGIDHGVNKGHTLDVYRLKPEPKYLGMIRIVDANQHQSVGRLIPSGNLPFRTPMAVGDLVTSRLTADGKKEKSDPPNEQPKK